MEDRAGRGADTRPISRRPWLFPVVLKGANMVKKFWRSSEFWIATLTAVGTIAGTLAGVLAPPVAATVAAIGAASYAIARSIRKR